MSKISKTILCNGGTLGSAFAEQDENPNEFFNTTKLHTRTVSHEEITSAKNMAQILIIDYFNGLELNWGFKTQIGSYRK